jgi:hypothetical protein
VTRFPLILALALIPSLYAACSSVDAGGRDGGAATLEGGIEDGGTKVEAAAVDSSLAEGAAPFDAGGPSEEADADAEGGPAGSLPNGAQLVVGTVVLLQGVTSDDYAIYIDGTASTLNAVPLSGGGAPILIAPVDPTTQVALSGSVAFYWTAVNQSTGAGTLAIWTSAHGAKTLSTSSQVPSAGFQVVAVSADGTMVLFYDQLDESGASGNLAVANVDGTGKTTLLSALDISSTSPCYSNFNFAGDSVVSVYAPWVAADAGPPVVAVAAFTGPSWSPVTLATNVECGLTVDGTGQFALVPTGGGLVAYPLPSGTPSLIDSTGSGGALLSPPAGSPPGTADDVLYADTSAELKRATIGSSSSPTLLLDSGVNYVWVVSPDTNWALTGQKYALASNVYLYDFGLASSTIPGAASTLVPTVSGTVLGDVFTADSSHVLYATAPTDGGTATAATPLTLFAAATGAAAAGDAGGGGDAGAAAARLLAVGAGEALAGVGAKVVYGVVEPGNNQAYDVFSVDTSETAPAVPLVSFADAPFFLSAQKDKLVYTWSQGDAIAGLYVLVIP